MLNASDWVLPVIAIGIASTASPATDILHEPVPCLAPGDYPVIDAAFGAESDIRTAKVYFRSAKYPKFYYVEMTPNETGFSSVLPRPSPETMRVVYYIEAVDVTFNNTVGAEHVVDIASDCAERRGRDDDPILAEPEITVGAVDASASALPPGFETVGIVGTITSAGLSSALGGGSGISTAVVASSVAAGVGGGVVAVAGSSDEPKPEEPPTPEAPVPGTSSAPAPSPPTPPPSPPGPESPSPPGPEPPTPPPGPESPTPPAPEPPPPPGPTPPAPEPPPPPGPPSPVTACFDASFPGGSCNMKLDASCSSGPVTRFDWTIDPGGAFGGVTTDSGVQVNRSFPNCLGEAVTVTLVVSSATGESDALSRRVQLPARLSLRALASDSLPCSVTSRIEAGPAAVNGLLIFDERRSVAVEGSAPSSYDATGREGEHRLDALAGGSGAEARWSFDFTGCASLARGSLRSDSGEVVVLEPGRIVLRLSGAAGERLAIRYRLGH